YPEVRRGPNAAPEPPYDVTAWSLGMLLGVDTAFVKEPLPASLTLTRIDGMPKLGGEGSGNGGRFTFDYKCPHTAIAINRLLKDGAHVAFDGASRVGVTGVSRAKVDEAAKTFGLNVTATEVKKSEAHNGGIPLRAPRIAMYQPW